MLEKHKDDFEISNGVLINLDTNSIALVFLFVKHIIKKLKKFNINFFNNI